MGNFVWFVVDLFVWIFTLIITFVSAFLWASGVGMACDNGCSPEHDEHGLIQFLQIMTEFNINNFPFYFLLGYGVCRYFGRNFFREGGGGFFWIPLVAGVSFFGLRVVGVIGTLI